MRTDVLNSKSSGYNKLEEPKIDEEDILLFVELYSLLLKWENEIIKNKGIKNESDNIM